MPNTTETEYFIGTCPKTKDGKPIPEVLRSAQRIIVRQSYRLVDEEGRPSGVSCKGHTTTYPHWKYEDIEIDCEKLWKLVK
jgi:hypothetical protein